MKKISLYLMSFLAVAGVSTSCTTDMLKLESKTSITTDYIFTTPDGLSRATIGLYDLDRDAMIGNSGTNGNVWLMDPGTDISLHRAGDASQHFRFNTVSSTATTFKNWWNNNYKIIGKSNEVIAAAEEMDMEDEQVLQAWAEAKVFRARLHFELWKKFDNIVLSTEPTTVDNLEQTFSPATKEEIFTQVKQDLDDVIAADALGWEPYSALTGALDYGRYTMAVVHHIRAQVATWEDDWAGALEHAQAIFDKSAYVYLMPNTIDCFIGADLNYAENLYVLQFGASIGGTVSTSDGAYTGHRMARITQPATDSALGATVLEYGGPGWGRTYPNTYCHSLYRDTDVRWGDDHSDTANPYKLYRTYWEWQDNDDYVGEEVIIDQYISSRTGTSYPAVFQYFHPQCLKYHDQWTNADEPDRTTSFRDIVIYRLAETYLIAAEACMRLGNASGALTYYNAIYGRSNPTAPYTETLSMGEIIDEYARELHFEGVYWGVLKRIDYNDGGTSAYWSADNPYVSLYDRVHTRAGDIPDDNRWMEITTATQDTSFSTGYAIARGSYQDYMKVWPIPSTQLELMTGYPQNEGW